MAIPTSRKTVRKTTDDDLTFEYAGHTMQAQMWAKQKGADGSMVELKKKPGGRMLQLSETKPVKEVRKPARSTSTNVSGGTRSSPPQVGGNGSGEAKSVKARSAAKARKTASVAGTNKARASKSK